MMKAANIVTLLTDFGAADGYVAAMRGVLLRYAPAARVVDGTHEIPPQDVQAASWTLAQYHRFYPDGTIHVAVVDPGVGMDRAILLAQVDGRFYLAPDNGLLTWVLEDAGDVVVRALKPGVNCPWPVSDTFHGRDVFAWAAAQLARNPGLWRRISRPISAVLKKDWPATVVKGRRLLGKIAHVDRFGNLITNIRRHHLPTATSCLIRAGTYANIPLIRTYGEGRKGTPAALFGSTGFMEISVIGGNAARRTGLRRGDTVECKNKKGRTP